MKLTKLFLTILGNQKSSITYLLRDDFTTTEAAPLASPRTCEPGPGTLTITDASNKMSIANGRLAIAGYTTNALDPLCNTPITRSGGLALIAEHYADANNRYTHLGFNTSATTWPTSYSCGNAGANFAIRNTYTGTLYTEAISAFPATVMTALILRASGAFLAYKGVTDAVWRLGFVYHISSANGYYGIGHVALSNAGYVESFRITQLSDPWDSAYGIATGYTASPSSGATLTHEADGFVEVTWTAATGVTLELDVRRTDADNRWIVRCAQADSTIKLIERDSGSESERSSASQTWTNGTAYRIIALMRGTTILTFVAVLTGAEIAKNSYTSATFNQAATTALITASGGALANFATWPHVLSGSALNRLSVL